MRYSGIFRLSMVAPDGDATVRALQCGPCARTAVLSLPWNVRASWERFRKGSEETKNRTWHMSISRLRGPDMNLATDAKRGVSAVPLLNAVFCVDCETISSSPHDACTICGSHSLINLFRMLGGTLRSQKAQSVSQAQPTKYNLELAAKVRGIPTTELNFIIESMTRLAEAGGAVESLRINVESVFDTQGVVRAA